MNSAGTTRPVAGPARTADLVPVLARWFLGVVFIYMGLSKVLHPVEFLKLVRQYDVLHHHLLLNLVASTVPWFEIFCGILLVLGVAVRGSAVTGVVMLLVFTSLVLWRALAIWKLGGVPFCAIQFDCGCGTGEVLICRKLGENALLTGIGAALVFWRSRRLCLRHTLFKTAHAPIQP